MKTGTIIFWIVRVIAALILLQTLFFKFSAAPESVEIFTRMGMEPWGRIGTGVVELISAILILVPSTVWLGAVLAAGVMGGAILSHLTVLGISVQNDHGQLFSYAVIVMVCALVALWKSRRDIPAGLRKFLPLFLQ